MGKKLQIHSKDSLVHNVIKKFDERSSVGYEKYGKTLAADSDSLYRWVNDVQEELMDAILYIQKVKDTLQEVTEETYVQEHKRAIEEENDMQYNKQHITDKDGNGAVNYNISSYPESNITVNYEVVSDK